MCGIVAVISKNFSGLSKSETDAFDDLLFIDQLRGKDSTGVFLVEKNGTMSLAKEASHSTDFRTKSEYKTLLTQAFRTGHALVGHNRSATRGEVSDENAHPFVVDDRITLVHNGTLWGDHKKLANTKVDSHAIAHTLHKYNNDVEKAMQEIDGAYAMIWHDFLTNQIKIVRNSQRPLYWMETNNAWYWASEENFLQWIATRHKLHLVDNKLHNLSESTLVTYSFANGTYSANSEKVTLVKPTPNINYNHGYNAYKGYGWNSRDEWDDQDDAGFCALYGGYEDPERPDVRKSLPPPTKLSNYARNKEVEEEIANKIGSVFSFSAYENATNGFRGDSYVPVVCIDFTEVLPGEESLGFYVFAELESDRDIMVRVHVPPNFMTDETLLDITLNQKRGLVCLKSKQWARYNLIPAHSIQNLGYAMYIAEGLKPIVKAESVNA